MRRRVAFTAVLFAFSGLQFSSAAHPVTIVSSDTIQDPRAPHAAIDDQGTIDVAFGAAKTIYFCKSVDGGASFDRPVKVADVKQLGLGFRRGPQIVAGKGTIVITAVSHEDGNIWAWRSTDGG